MNRIVFICSIICLGCTIMNIFNTGNINCCVIILRSEKECFIGCIMDTSVGNIQKDNNALKRKREEQQIMSEEPKGKSIKDMSGSIKKNSSNENLLELPLPDYSIEFTNKSQLKWYDLTGENLNCTYCMLLSHIEADKLLSWCEENIQYNSKEASKVRIMGKWHDIPRKQVR